MVDGDPAGEDADEPARDRGIREATDRPRRVIGLNEDQLQRLLAST